MLWQRVRTRAMLIVYLAFGFNPSPAQFPVSGRGRFPVGQAARVVILGCANSIHKLRQRRTIRPASAYPVIGIYRAKSVLFS